MHYMKKTYIKNIKLREKFFRILSVDGFKIV